MDNLSVLSLLPVSQVVVVGVLLAGFRRPAKLAMPVGSVVVVVVALFVHQMNPTAVLTSSIQGLIIAGTLLYTVLGALLLVETLTKSGAMSTIRAGFTSTSSRPGCGAGPRCSCVTSASPLPTHPARALTAGWGRGRWRSWAPGRSPASRPCSTSSASPPPCAPPTWSPPASARSTSRACSAKRRSGWPRPTGVRVSPSSRWSVGSRSDDAQVHGAGFRAARALLELQPDAGRAVAGAPRSSPAHPTNGHRIDHGGPCQRHRRSTGNGRTHT